MVVPDDNIVQTTTAKYFSATLILTKKALVICQNDYDTTSTNIRILVENQLKL